MLDVNDLSYDLKKVKNLETKKVRYYINNSRVSKQLFEKYEDDYIIFPRRDNFISYERNGLSYEVKTIYK